MCSYLQLGEFDSLVWQFLDAYVRVFNGTAIRQYLERVDHHPGFIGFVTCRQFHTFEQLYRQKICTLNKRFYDTAPSLMECDIEASQLYRTAVRELVRAIATSRTNGHQTAVPQKSNYWSQSNSLGYPQLVKQMSTRRDAEAAGKPTWSENMPLLAEKLRE